MIFRRVDDDFREMLKLELVCRRWRKLMRDHGWKHLRRVASGRNRRWMTLPPHKWIGPIGERCGGHLVDCTFFGVDIDINLMRLISRYLPALRHLKFHFCQLEILEENVLNAFPPEFGAHLRSLTILQTKYNHPRLQPGGYYPFLRHFPHLRHLGLDLSSDHNHNYTNEISRYFLDYLRSLYLSYCSELISVDLEQMLMRMQTVSPGLTALYLDTKTVRGATLLRISELENLRFLHLGHIDNPDLLCSCLANLPHLRALQINLTIQQLPFVFRSPVFRGLVHLGLSLDVSGSVNLESIGLLSTFAPQLRSLNLNITKHSSKDVAQGIARQVLKIARSGNLEHLNVSCASFMVAGVDQLIRLCPNLHCACILSSHRPLSEFAELGRVVADQWRAGTRKHLPLRIWILVPRRFYYLSVHVAVCQDPFVTVYQVNSSSFIPHNAVLDQLFREEVFNGEDDGGTPSFVTEYYSDCVQATRVPTNDLMIS